MQASEIQVGDQFVVDGVEQYRVEGVRTGLGLSADATEDRLVQARVRYRDGGTGERVFNYDLDVPLVRPVTK